MRVNALKSLGNYDLQNHPDVISVFLRSFDSGNPYVSLTALSAFGGLKLKGYPEALSRLESIAGSSEIWQLRAEAATALAKLLGVADRVVGIPTLKCTVADFLHDEANALAMIIVMGRSLMEDHGAEALVLGCGATTGLAPRIARELGIPVLDPGLTAVKYAEMLVDLGLSHSKRAYPYNPRVMQLLAGMSAGSL